MECARPLALWLPGCAGRQENARRRVSAKRQRPAALQDAGALPEAPRRGGAYGVRPASGALAAGVRRKATERSTAGECKAAEACRTRRRWRVAGGAPAWRSLWSAPGLWRFGCRGAQEGKRTLDAV